MLAVTEAQYSGNYLVSLVFNDGKRGLADLKETIFSDKRPIFSILKDESFFSQFKLEHDTLTWPNELDLAVEYLYFLAFKHDEDLKEKFRNWGYLP